MSQPVWKPLLTSEFSRVEVDQTGKYAPEMELAQEMNSGKLEVFRFELGRCKEVRGYLVPFEYDHDWAYPVAQYEEWFAGDLQKAAEACGTTEMKLRAAICSEHVSERAWAYEAIGCYWGFLNLDSCPLRLTREQLDTRWAS